MRDTSGLSDTRKVSTWRQSRVKSGEASISELIFWKLCSRKSFSKFWQITKVYNFWHSKIFNTKYLTSGEPGHFVWSKNFLIKVFEETIFCRDHIFSATFPFHGYILNFSKKWKFCPLKKLYVLEVLSNIFEILYKCI